MDTDDNVKANVEKSTVAKGKLQMFFGTIAILAVAGLAALVFSRYEAGISPDESAAVTPSHRLIPVTVSTQGLALETGNRPAVTTSVAAHGSSALPHDQPMAAHGPWCGLHQSGQT
jgi:hypothetical protein